MTGPDEKVTTGQEADPADEFLTAAEAHAADERQFVLPGSGQWSCLDVPLLVAAVRAVLDLHKPDGFVGAVTLCDEHLIWQKPLTEAIRQQRIACPDCGVTEHPRCWHAGCPDEWPCPTYTAITAALAGKDAPDEH
jgi:hypothetical protein